MSDPTFTTPWYRVTPGVKVDVKVPVGVARIEIHDREPAAFRLVFTGEAFAGPEERLASLDALLASEEPPAGLWNATSAPQKEVRKIWRWFRERLGEAANQPKPWFQGLTFEEVRERLFADRTPGKAFEVPPGFMDWLAGQKPQRPVVERPAHTLGTLSANAVGNHWEVWVRRDGQFPRHLLPEEDAREIARRCNEWPAMTVRAAALGGALAISRRGEDHEAEQRDLANAKLAALEAERDRFLDENRIHAAHRARLEEERTGGCKATSTTPWGC